MVFIMMQIILRIVFPGVEWPLKTFTRVGDKHPEPDNGIGGNERHCPNEAEGGPPMARSILDGRRILAVDDEPDVLSVLEEEILGACLDCTIDKSTSYEGAVDLLRRNDYDIAILDIMGVQGFDLLQIAARRKLRTVMLTAKALTPEDLKRSLDLGAWAFLPKDKLGEIVPFLEDALRYERKTGWDRLLKKLEDYFDNRWGSEWKKKYPFSY